MVSLYYISITLDTRREKTNGKYPVRLRAYTPTPKKQKLYQTIFSFTKDEFKSIWEVKTPTGKNKDANKKLQAVLNNANEIADKIKPFNFDEFERKLFRKKSDGVNLDYQYTQRINELKKRGQIGTANNYSQSKNSFVSFEKSKKKKFKDLSFYDITQSWLEDYENFMRKNNKSLNTVSIYTRNLRTIFNIAIDDKEIEKEFYPFGKRKYIIPNTGKKKSALKKNELSLLFETKPQTPEQQKAKDFWFFSFACQGVNIKDIALLKNKNLDNEKFIFVREKTKLTSKDRTEPITVYLNNYSKSILDKYGNKNKAKNKLVFDIVNESMNIADQQRAIKNFTRFINQHMSKLAKLANISSPVSVNVARHSFATVSMNKGASMDFMRESLGHKNLKTTMNYFAGFDDDTKKEFSNNIMDF